MTDDDEKQETALAAQGAHQLSIRASLVKRGLRNIYENRNTGTVLGAREKAFQLYKQKRFDDAILLCDAGLALDPADEALWQIKGLCLSGQGNYAEALNCIDKALATNRENPYCWCIKASCLSSADRHLEAVACMDYAIKLDPENRDFRARKAGYLAAVKKDAHASSIDLTNPSIFGTVRGWYVEPMPHFPDMRYVNLVFELENRSDSLQRLGKEVTLFHRSRTTGEVSALADGILLSFSPELQLPPHSDVAEVDLELAITCPASETDEECLRQVFNDSSDLLGYDQRCETVILFVFE